MTHDLSVRYGDAIIPFRIRRSDQASPRIRVHVESDGRVVVHAPTEISDDEVAAAVRQRSRWIYTHLRAIADRKSRLPLRDWVSGESHRYLGRRYMLKVRIAPDSPERVTLSGGQLRVSVQAVDRRRVRRLVQDWYRERAAAWLKNRVGEIGQQLPWVRKPPSVAIRRMKSRWGSCSPAGRLTLNPVLIRASRESVDYVIVHELCHLRHHNHGKSFYALLGRYVPGWQDIKKRLDDMADTLHAEQG